MDTRQEKLAADMAAERGMTLKEAEAAIVRADRSGPEAASVDAEPMRTVCGGCGKERSAPTAAGIYPCSCGSTAVVTGTLLGVCAPANPHMPLDFDSNSGA